MSGDFFKDFDDFVDENEIKSDEMAAAFAAFLNKTSGWDGKYEEVKNDD